MLQSEIIYNLKNLKAGGIQSDDENLADAQMAFIIDYYRAKLLRQQAMKHGSYNRQLVQDLGKIEVISVDPHECGCPKGGCIIRTKLEIPKTLDLGNGDNHFFTFVGLYGGIAFQETSWQRAPWDFYAKYTGKQPKWFIKGRYIYILNPPDPLLKWINIQGIFESPKVAIQFRTCDCPNGQDCMDLNNFDFEYPMPIYLVDTLVKMAMEGEMQWSVMDPPDTLNDSLDSN
jgi:hypothetical protein